LATAGLFSACPARSLEFKQLAISASRRHSSANVTIAVRLFLRADEECRAVIVATDACLDAELASFENFDSEAIVNRTIEICVDTFQHISAVAIMKSGLHFTDRISIGPNREMRGFVQRRNDAQSKVIDRILS
jgi:hypothetical protein